MNRRIRCTPRGTALATLAIALLWVGARPSLAADQPAAAAVTALTPADLAWERLKKLEGSWKGYSTKGWQEDLAIRLIAHGSTLLETSRFTSDPEGKEDMATAYLRDGDRLLLTHYCQAGNQPRLVATRFEDNGATVVFSFLDGTNLPSRETGHMDQVVLRFGDDDHFTSRWSWYEAGSEKWFEDIRYERVAKR
jgi:hypothetical protein